MEEEDGVFNSSPINNTSPNPKNKSIFNSSSVLPISKTTKAGSVIHGYNLGIGDSEYDKGLTWGTDINENDIQGSINEHRAQEQSGLIKLAATPFRAAVKAATEVAKLAPIVYGVGKAAFENNDTSTLDDIFNNEGIKLLDKMNESINTEFLPVYARKAVTEGSFLTQISSPEFWGTEAADGIGFMASMFVPGMIVGKLGLGARLIGGLDKVSRGTKIAASFEKSTQMLSKIGWTGASANIDSKISVLANSLIEAGSESKGVGDSLDAKKDDIVNDYMLQGKSQEEAEQLFKQQRDRAMSADFITQLPMLIGTGSIMHKAIFGKVGNKVESVVEQSLKQRVGSVAKQFGKATLSEGFIEEGGQSTLEKYFTKTAAEGTLGGHIYDDINIGDLTKEYINTVSSTDGQKAIFLGAVMGGPAMSMEARREYKKGLKDTNSITNGVNSAIDDYTKVSENDIYKKDPLDSSKYLYKKDEQGNDTTERVIDHAKAIEVAKAYHNTEIDDNEYENAIKSDDIELQKFIQNRSILKLIAPAIQNGKLGLEILAKQLKEASNLTDIADRNNSSKDKDSSETFNKQVLEKAKHLQEQNEKFKDFAGDVIELNDPRATKKDNEDYLDHLNSKYLETKSLQYDAENKLKDLVKKRDNVFNELNINLNLTPTEILNDKISISKNQHRNPLLNNVLKKIDQTEKEISKHKQDVHDLWNNKSLVKEAFTKVLDEKEKLQHLTSEETTAKTQDFVSEINNIDEIEDLDKFTKENKDYLTQNPAINEFIKSKVEERKEVIKQVKLEEARQQAEVEHQENLDREEDNPTDGTPTNVVTQGQPLDKGTESLQSSDTLELNEVDAKEFEEILDTKKAKGARLNSIIIHTKDQKENPQNYPKLKEEGSPISEAYRSMVAYERDPRDKSKDNVTFDFGDFKYNKETITAGNLITKLKNGTPLEIEEIKFLEDYLPIKVTLSHKDNSASSFLDSMSHPENEIVEKETLPLRKSIVQSLIQNKGEFKGITGKVRDQFPGVLKTEDESNNVLALQFLKLQKDPLAYFQNNTGYVNYQGLYCKALTGRTTNDAPQFKKKDPAKHKGELFLKIEQNNGSPFFLKLNTNKISEGKSNALFDLMKLKFEVEANDISLISLKAYVEQHPEYQSILSELDREIKFIEGNSNKTINETVNRLIDMLIYNGNHNSHTAFGLYFKNSTVIGNKGELYTGETGIQVGTLFNKLYDNDLFRQSISSEEFLNNPEEFRKSFVDFFQYKRHNVLFKSGNGLTFQNKDYLQYLTDEVLSTNANVEQTFQGYSNIYLESHVKNGNKVVNSNKKIEEVIPMSPPEVVAKQQLEIQTAEDLLKAIDYGNEYVANLDTIVELPDNNNTLSGLIKSFDNLKTSNPKEYNKRLLAIIKTLPNTGIEALQKGHVFVLTEAVNEGVPIEGNKIKKDC